MKMKFLLTVLLLLSGSAFAQIGTTDGRTIKPSSLPLDRIVPIPEGTVLGNCSGSSGVPTACPASSASPALTGDVTKAAGSNPTVVQSVGGVSAANVAAGANAANAATNANTVSTIVKRDASGNFAGNFLTGGSFRLKDVSGVAAYDGEILSLLGGSTDGRGVIVFRSAGQDFRSYDNTRNFQISESTASEEWLFAQGGSAGAGATLVAVNSTRTGNVPLNFVALGTSPIRFSNGSGEGARLIDPGAAINAQVELRGGTSLIAPTIQGSNASFNVNARSGGTINLTVADARKVAIHDGAAGGDNNYLDLSADDLGAHVGVGGAGGNVLTLRSRGAANIELETEAGLDFLALVGPVSGTMLSGPALRPASTTDPIRLSSTGHSILIGGNTATAGNIGAAATSGYLQIPYGNGEPLGVPTELNNGGVPIYYNVSDKGLYGYSGGVWSPAASAPLQNVAYASLPAAAGLTGRKYLLTDYPCEVYSTGSTWKPLNGRCAIAQGTAPISNTGSTTENPLVTLSIAANLLGIAGCVEVDSLWSWPATANTKTWRVKFDTATFTQLQVTTNTTYGARTLTRFCNVNSTTAQEALEMGASFSGLGTMGAAPTTAAVDTTVAKNLVISAQNGDAAETIRLVNYTIYWVK